MSRKTVYGPVRSWRVGLSLGVDLLSINSICSFRCVYCQLGKINVHTMERRLFVTTAQVMSELKASAWQNVDIITLSGSGEPTLASNLGEAIRQIKEFTRKPVLVLTNASLLYDTCVRSELSQADKVFCKLDAIDERAFRRVNRPVARLTLRGIIDGIKLFKDEYEGYLALQIMLQQTEAAQIEWLAEILNEIRPREVQLNTPLRAVPKRWMSEARGQFMPSVAASVRPKVIGREEAARTNLRLQELTGLKVTSVYDHR